MGFGSGFGPKWSWDIGGSSNLHLEIFIFRFDLASWLRRSKKIFPMSLCDDSILMSSAKAHIIPTSLRSPLSANAVSIAKRCRCIPIAKKVMASGSPCLTPVDEYPNISPDDEMRADRLLYVEMKNGMSLGSMSLRPLYMSNRHIEPKAFSTSMSRRRYPRSCNIWVILAHISAPPGTPTHSWIGLSFNPTPCFTTSFSIMHRILKKDSPMPRGRSDLSLLGMSTHLDVVHSSMIDSGSSPFAALLKNLRIPGLLNFLSLPLVTADMDLKVQPDGPGAESTFRCSNVPASASFNTSRRSLGSVRGAQSGRMSLADPFGLRRAMISLVSSRDLYMGAVSVFFI